MLSENDFEAVLANFCCYEYGANTSEAVQNISKSTLEKKLETYEKTYLAVYYLFAGDTSQNFIFFQT